MILSVGGVEIVKNVLRYKVLDNRNTYWEKFNAVAKMMFC